MVYSHRILSSNKNEWSTIIYNKIDESQKHNAKQKCPDIEGYMAHDSIYIKYKKKKLLLEVGIEVAIGVGEQ